MHIIIIGIIEIYIPLMGYLFNKGVIGVNDVYIMGALAGCIDVVLFIIADKHKKGENNV